ncbi:hypothetical protein MCP1_4600001 [Candidatus Terasakiella magnetica]|nr:hypothetical protein MCP1_4600001 [Candidatus Terasakiella magnetica]
MNATVFNTTADMTTSARSLLT